jgi:curved DNA-binding protein CbpA
MARMARPDPYKLLQVDPEADIEIIQVAYRKLAQRYHPDVVPGPEAARLMAELNAARDLLADPAARAALDRSRATAPAADGDQGSGASRSAATVANDRASPTGGPATGPGDGPRPGTPSGSVLAFGRYAGWSLGEVARRDIEYVEWLDRMPIGRPHRAEIDAILRRAGRRGAVARTEEPRGLYRRR